MAHSDLRHNFIWRTRGRLFLLVERLPHPAELGFTPACMAFSEEAPASHLPGIRRRQSDLRVHCWPPRVGTDNLFRLP